MRGFWKGRRPVGAAGPAVSGSRSHGPLLRYSQSCRCCQALASCVYSYRLLRFSAVGPSLQARCFTPLFVLARALSLRERRRPRPSSRRGVWPWPDRSAPVRCFGLCSDPHQRQSRAYSSHLCCHGCFYRSFWSTPCRREAIVSARVGDRVTAGRLRLDWAPKVAGGGERVWTHRRAVRAAHECNSADSQQQHLGLYHLPIHPAAVPESANVPARSSSSDQSRFAPLLQSPHRAAAILILGVLVYHLFIKPTYVSKIRNVPGPSTRNLISGNLAQIFEGVHDGSSLVA